MLTDNNRAIGLLPLAGHHFISILDAWEVCFFGCFWCALTCLDMSK